MEAPPTCWDVRRLGRRAESAYGTCTGKAWNVSDLGSASSGCLGLIMQGRLEILNQAFPPTDRNRAQSTDNLLPGTAPCQHRDAGLCDCKATTLCLRRVRAGYRRLANTLRRSGSQEGK